MSMGTSSDDSFKRPGAVPFKWESQPGVPKHTGNPLAAAPSSRPKLQPPPSRARHHHSHARSASASPSRSRPSFAPRTASPSASPSWKLPITATAVVSQGCFPAGYPLKRGDGRSKSKGSPEAAPPRRPAPARRFSACSAPLGRSSPPAREVATPRRSLAFSGPLGSSPRVAEEDWARRGSPAFLSPPLGRYHRATEEAVSATRWLF